MEMQFFFLPRQWKKKKNKIKKTKQNKQAALFPHLGADAVRQSSVPFHRCWPIKAFSARQTPLAIDCVVVQATSMTKPQADAPLRGSVAGTVLQAAWTEALSGWHSHRRTEGQLWAGQVLTQQALDGGSALERVYQACIHPALRLAKQCQGKGLRMDRPARSNRIVSSWKQRPGVPVLKDLIWIYINLKRHIKGRDSNL